MNLIENLRIGLPIASILLLVGCYYEDVSHQPAYSNLIGSVVELRSELLIFGVDAEMDERDAVDLYRITPYPGIDGPEIKSGWPLPVGTSILIQSVIACTMCFFSDVFLMVRILSDKRFDDVPVHLDGSSSHPLFSEPINGNATLNPDIFERNEDPER
jgi:hypothetical protein